MTWGPARGSGESPHWAEPGQAPPPHPTTATAIPGQPQALLGPRPQPAETSKTGNSSEPRLSGRGSSKGLAWLLPTAGSNWFEQGAASADCIPGLRLAACSRPFQGLGSLGRSTGSGACGRNHASSGETRPWANLVFV